MKVQGRRKRGRPKRRRLDIVQDDIKEKGLSADDVYDCATWRRMSSYIDLPSQWEYDEGGGKKDMLRHKLVTFQFKVFSNISVKVNRKGNFFLFKTFFGIMTYLCNGRDIFVRIMSINYSISCAQHGIIHYCGMVIICLLSQFRYTVSFDRRFQVEDRVGQ